MSTGIEKYQAEETVRMSFFKHRGDVHQIVKDTGYHIDYVTRVVNKIEKKRKKEVDFHIASAISTEILDGHDSRVAHIRGIISRIEEQAQNAKSFCCRAAYRVQPFENQKFYFCTECGKECVLNFPKENITEYRQLLKLWSEEDGALALFAEKMGLTFKEDAPVVKQNNFFIQNNDGQQQRKQITSEVLDDEGREIISEAKDMDPRTRERLRKKLEAKALEAIEGVKKKDDNPKEEDR